MIKYDDLITVRAIGKRLCSWEGKMVRFHSVQDKQADMGKLNGMWEIFSYKDTLILVVDQSNGNEPTRKTLKGIFLNAVTDLKQPPRTNTCQLNFIDKGSRICAAIEFIGHKAKESKEVYDKVVELVQGREKKQFGGQRSNVGPKSSTARTVSTVPGNFSFRNPYDIFDSSGRSEKRKIEDFDPREKAAVPTSNNKVMSARTGITPNVRNVNLGSMVRDNFVTSPEVSSDTVPISQMSSVEKPAFDPVLLPDGSPRFVERVLPDKVLEKRSVPVETPRRAANSLKRNAKVHTREPIFESPPEGKPIFLKKKFHGQTSIIPPLLKSLHKDPKSGYSDEPITSGRTVLKDQQQPSEAFGRNQGSVTLRKRQTHIPDVDLAEKENSDVPDRSHGLGMRNYGNTCYLNSVLQLLIGEEDFKRKLIDVRRRIEESLLSGGDLCKAFANLCTTEERDKVVDEIKKIVADRAHIFKGYRQQDAHEFLNEVLNMLHDEVSKLNGSRDELFAEGDDGPLPNPVLESFCFNVQHSLQCQTCGFIGISEERFLHLGLDIPFSKTVARSLQELLDCFFMGESVEYTCEKCGGKESWRTHYFAEKPRILLLYLKRFCFHEATEKSVKVLTPIDIPPFITLDHLLVTNKVEEEAWAFKGLEGPPMGDGQSKSDEEKPETKTAAEMVPKVEDPEMVPKVKDMVEGDKVVPMKLELEDSINDEEKTDDESGVFVIEEQSVESIIKKDSVSVSECGTQAENPVDDDIFDYSSGEDIFGKDMESNKKNKRQMDPNSDSDEAISHKRKKPKATPPLTNEPRNSEDKFEEDLAKAIEESKMEFEAKPTDTDYIDQQLILLGTKDRKRIKENELIGCLPNSYRLIGVVNHKGLSSSSGHYTCDSFRDGQWMAFDDKKVKDTTLEEIQEKRKQEGYIFAYLADAIS